MRPDKMLAGTLSRAPALRSQTEALELRRRPRLSRGPTERLHAANAHPWPRPISHTAPRTRLEAHPHQAHRNRNSVSPAQESLQTPPSPPGLRTALLGATSVAVRWLPPAARAPSRRATRRLPHPVSLSSCHPVMSCPSPRQAERSMDAQGCRIKRQHNLSRLGVSFCSACLSRGHASRGASICVSESLCPWHLNAVYLNLRQEKRCPLCPDQTPRLPFWKDNILPA